jgi:hypothetical protein
MFPSASRGIASPDAVAPDKVTLIPPAPIEIMLLDRDIDTVVALPPIRTAPSPGLASGAFGAGIVDVVDTTVDWTAG